MTIWIKARCPVCHREYEYPEGKYKPKTCSDFDCAYKFIHYPERYQSFNEILDHSRREARV